MTNENCPTSVNRYWWSTPLTAPSQRLIHTNPRSAACAISTAQGYHSNVGSNSSSGIRSGATPYHASFEHA